MNRKILLFIVLLHSFSHARVVELNGRSRFFHCINKPILVVAYFYQLDRKCKDKNLEQCIRSDKERLSAISSNSKYQYAHVSFISVNALNDAGLAKELAINTFPTILLFKDGLPVAGGKLVGSMNEIKVKKFIDEHIGQMVNNIVAQKNEYELELLKAGCGYGYGCGYMRPYFCWPYYGFGYGYGGCCGPWYW